jgi:hypothetical protein
VYVASRAWQQNLSLVPFTRQAACTIIWSWRDGDEKLRTNATWTHDYAAVHFACTFAGLCTRPGSAVSAASIIRRRRVIRCAETGQSISCVRIRSWVR